MARKGSIKVIVRGNRSMIQEDLGDEVKVYTAEEWAAELERRQKGVETPEKVKKEVKTPSAKSASTKKLGASKKAPTTPKVKKTEVKKEEPAVK